MPEEVMEAGEEGGGQKYRRVVYLPGLPQPGINSWLFLSPLLHRAASL